MLVDDSAEEEKSEENEGQEYIFYDIETRQDGQHVANFLIMQDESGFEMIFKGEDCVD